MSNFNINPKKNYRRLSNGHVFTADQITRLLELAKPEMQAVILLDIMPTDEPATNPGSKYGLEAESGPI